MIQMNSRERKLRLLVSSVTPREDAVVAKVTLRDVENFKAGMLTYSDDTPESVAKRLERIRKRG